MHQSCCSQGGCGCQSNSCQKSQCGCQKSCGCGCSSCSCQGQSGCNYAEKFLALANQAWMEVLKEKIKEHIQSQATNMDELARLISEANHEQWQKKIEDKQCCGGYEEKLKAFFGQVCHTQERKK